MRLIITAFILSALYVLPSLAEPFAYVANFDSNDVSVVDLSTNKVVDTVDVGSGPIGVAVGDDGKSVYVSNLSLIHISSGRDRTRARMPYSS